MKHIHNSKELRSRRQELRKNATPQEIKLWSYLRKKKVGFQFYRQHSIGPYVVDFYCSSKRLIIELDGNYHTDTLEYDLERTKYFNYLNFSVIRFWNQELNQDIETIITAIKKVLNED